MTPAKLPPDKVRELVATIEAWQEIVSARGGRHYTRIGAHRLADLTPEERAAMEARTTGPLPTLEEKH